ncbi:MAG: hypothetical protein HY420_01880 [Candidatus Kerfeldbacteria bacterium]|nr:hypothetical protein [Candidatus Kerfeldbacteria bacterium]
MRQRILGGIAVLIVVLLTASAATAIGPITSVAISPSAQSLAAGASQTFTVQGQDANGATADLTANSTFTTTDPRGFMTANVYTAGTAGAWVVSANYNNLSAEAKVTVTPGEIKELVVNPNSLPEYMQNGESRTFMAEAFDGFNNPIKDFSVQWSLEGKIGTITALNNDRAKFTATDVGKGRVLAKSGNETALVDVAVTKSPEPPALVNVNTNTTPQTNANGNTNASPVVDETNLTADANANENTNAGVTAEPTICTGWTKTSWVWIFILYVVLLALSLAMIRTSRPPWWWVAPFILTVGALWIYFQYRCYPVYPAWPYLVLLVAIIGASWFTWRRGGPLPPS